MKRFLPILTLVTLAASPLAAKSDIEAAIERINKHFKRTHFVARVPLASGQTKHAKIIVTPDGQLDMERYRKMIGITGVSFTPGESGKRIWFNPHPKKGVIRVALIKKTFPKSVIEIDYGRPLSIEDITRENLVRALVNLIEIDGEPLPTDFDPEAFAEFLAGEGTESLTDVGAGQLAAAVTPTPQAAPTPEVPAVYDPELQVLSAEVDPIQAKPGQEIRLQIHFELSGVPEGRSVPITIERQLYFRDEPLFSTPETTTEDWPTGRHTSSIVLPVPTDAPVGMFRLAVTVRGAGSEQREEALFAIEP